MSRRVYPQQLCISITGDFMKFSEWVLYHYWYIICLQFNNYPTRQSFFNQVNSSLHLRCAVYMPDSEASRLLTWRSRHGSNFGKPIQKGMERGEHQATQHTHQSISATLTFQPWFGNMLYRPLNCVLPPFVVGNHSTSGKYGKSGAKCNE